MIKGFKIIKSQDVLESLLDYRKTYNDRGKYLGFNNINEFYTMQLGSCTDWTGFPRSGKTQVLMEMLLNTSIIHGWKHLVYFPDVGNKIEIVSDLIHKITGKSFNPKHPNHISDDEIYKSIEFITHHFKILTKSDVKAKMTPYEFWDYAVEIKEEEGLHTVCIDSWKDLNHPYDKMGGYATYLEDVLPYRNMIAEEHNLHLHTIIHPKLTEKVNGKRSAPTPYDLKGGSEWFNSGKCMVTVHREDVGDIKADIFFHKIKPRSIGNTGQATLYFDVEKFVYYEMVDEDHGIKRYAQKEGEQKTNEIPVLSELQPNNLF